MRRFVGALVCTAAIAVAAPATDVYMIGDSTMAERTQPNYPEQGWGQHLSQFFDSTVRIRNFAVNGRSTKSFIAEGKWANVVRQLKRGDYLLIQFGHNDEKADDSTRYAQAATAFQANLERFVTDARRKGAQPILLTPIVRRKFDAQGRLVDTHGEYPDAVRAVAARLNVKLVDMTKLTASLVGGAGPEASKRYYVWLAAGESTVFPEGRQDDTHLSLAGATEVARLAARALAGVVR